MLIALIKLGDIAARSLFVVIALYTLPARTTGQFGLALTLIGFFAFLCGFERHADLQRRLVGKSTAEADRLVLWAVRFFCVNYLLWSPVLAALLTFWVDLDPALAALCVAIAVGEHLSNEVYRIALIIPRHRPVLFAVLAKNSLLLCGVVGTMWVRDQTLGLEQLLKIWAAMSSLGVLFAATIFIRTADIGGGQSTPLPAPSLGDQYRASRTHFLIGVIALAALQSDRLVVGGLLTLEQSGVYFRHVFLASFVYQVFNVASYNRLAPKVYAHMIAGHPMLARKTVRREMTVLIPGTLTVLVAMPFIDLSVLRRIKSVSALSSIMPNCLAILVFGFLVRTIADYNALLLNSVYRERDIFVSQLASVVVALGLNLFLTKTFGMAGTVATGVVGAFLYASLSSLYVRGNQQLQ